MYLPAGVTTRLRITDDSRLAINAEYDHLVEGWQTTDLKDVSASEPNNTDGQFGGYGLRGSVMYEQTSWSAGPFFNYWNINQSGSTVFGGSIHEFEPHNQTLEYGVQARYRF